MLLYSRKEKLLKNNTFTVQNKHSQAKLNHTLVIYNVLYVISVHRMKLFLHKMLLFFFTMIVTNL